MNKEHQKADKKTQLLGSLLLFTQYFYEKRTGRPFELSHPDSQESHYITICRELTKSCREADFNRLIINCPPRYGKTELLIHYVAWSLARYPSSNFLYISYSHSLAKKQTQIIRQIISMPEYKDFFDIQLSRESSAKDNFETVQGGSVYAAGAGGTITGRGAGIQNSSDFGGAIIIDDIHKPSEVSSDTMRNSIVDWYLNTLQSRVNSPITPIIFIGQRLHEDDLPANLMRGFDGHIWHKLIIAALNRLEQPLHPALHTKEMLLKMQKQMPYEFASQYQQNPQPAGGGLFKPEWFVLKDETPKMLATFITADTAETNKTYNDATVFSFWGIYKIQNEYDNDLDLYGLHWIDCEEIWIEPNELAPAFFNFYASCMRFTTKPKVAAIEKKSTGTTLVSTIKNIQGLKIIEIERNRSSGSKATRFIQVQSYVASKHISVNVTARHKDLVIDHMKKITANDTHRYDDIADTLTDAIQLGLVDRVIPFDHTGKTQSDIVLDTMARTLNKRLSMGDPSWQHRTWQRNI